MDRLAAEADLLPLARFDIHFRVENSSPGGSKMDSLRAKYDVVIAGGGIIGCHVAYFLKRRNAAIEVAVVEPDSSYEYASTVRASGGARRLFSCPENIQMSNFSIERIKNFPTEMAVGEDPVP